MDSYKTYEVTVADSRNPCCIQRDTFKIRAPNPECAESWAWSEYMDSLPPDDMSTGLCVDVVSCKLVKGRERDLHEAVGVAA